MGVCEDMGKKRKEIMNANNGLDTQSEVTILLRENRILKRYHQTKIMLCFKGVAKGGMQ